MKKLLLFATLVVLVVSCSTNQSDPEDVSAADYNVRRANELCDEVFGFLPLIEGGTRADGCAYYDQDVRTLTSSGHPNARLVEGGRWTTWYGITVKPDGYFLKPYEKISREKAACWAKEHLRQKVFPFFCYFKRKLTDEQIIGTALFMYNVGGEAVTGYSLEGVCQGDPSRFLIAINNGKDDDVCVNCMTRYRKSGGRRATGLLKRHWVQGGAFKGILTSENIRPLRPVWFYETKNLGNYYWLDRRRELVERDGLYQLRYDKTTIECFFSMNVAHEGQQKVEDLL